MNDDTLSMVSIPPTSVICTLGMHRSGTSLVSRLLNLVGVHLGKSQSTAGRGEDNPKGYWEHRPLALLSEEILMRLGGRWDRPPAFPPSWSRDPGLEDLRAQARHLLHEEFADAPLWGWKDPRSSLTLPFWQDLIGPMRYVVCVRNPCAVIASLSRRDGMAAPAAERLWLTHVQASLAHTSSHPRLLVFYEDVLADWQRELRRLAAFVGRAEQADNPAVVAEAADFLEETLCHHRMSLEDVAGDRRLSFAAKSLYLALQGVAPRGLASGDSGASNRSDRIAHTTLDLLAAHARESCDGNAAAAETRQSLVRERDAHATETRRLCAERERVANEASALRDNLAALAAEAEQGAAREAGLVDIVTRLEAEARRAAVERDELLQQREDQASTIARLSTERQALTSQAAALMATTEALSDECRDFALGDERLREAVVCLEAELQGALDERDRHTLRGAALERTIQEIYASGTWRMVTSLRRMLAAWLPADTRRHHLFHSLLRLIVRRTPPAQGAPPAVVELHTS